VVEAEARLRIWKDFLFPLCNNGAKKSMLVITVTDY
jgi:hypothetical protein